MTLEKQSIETAKVAVVIPAYRASKQIIGVLKGIDSYISWIIVVDDACPENTGSLVVSEFLDNRLTVLTNPKNLGVGGSVIRGYKKAIELGCNVIVKIDADGQMDSTLIPKFIEPILNQEADYTKGNRFLEVGSIKKMPLTRLIGNIGLSFFSKISTGYWEIFDPTNGFTAIDSRMASRLPLELISKRYFFESDILFRLNLNRAVVMDIPIEPLYGEEKSNLNIFYAFVEFPIKHLRNFIKRIYYSYYLRQFSIASLELPLSIVSLATGLTVGIRTWIKSARSGIPSTSGTVVLASIFFITGVQLMLSFLEYDFKSSPKIPISKFL
jgi:hypothetical protein